MNRESIKDVLRDVFGDITMQDIGSWVSIQCPLAPWTHARGADGRPSAGVSVQDNDTSMFNCFSAETRYLTRFGVRTFSDTAGTYQEVLSPNGEWVMARIRAFGNDSIVKVTLSRNGVRKVIRTTGSHRWFRIGEGGSTASEKTTMQLQKGDRLVHSYPRKRTQWGVDLSGFLHGLIYGDGTAHENGRHGRVSLFGEKMKLADLFVGSNVNISPVAATEHAPEHVDLSGPFAEMKQLPSLANTEPYLLGFVAGYLASDGHVDKKGLPSISSSNRFALQTMRDICTYIGIGTFPIGYQEREGYRDEATPIYRVNFVRSTIDPQLFLRNDQRRRFVEADAPKYERLRWSVVSVEPTTEREKVYCAEVPVHHAFTLEDNILTGNCFTCHNPKPFHEMLRDYAGYTGDNLDDLIEELEEEAYLGPRHIPDWETLKGKNQEELLMPLNEGIYMDLYDSAVGHPYVIERGISDETAAKLELLFDPRDPADKEPRILFPVRGYDGLLYGFSGRATRKQALLKVRDYHGLKKSMNVLGAHLVARDNPKRILAVEGLFDYANSHQCGEHGCAVMHSTMTDAQAEIFRMMGKPTYLFFDNPEIDNAGAEAVEIAGKKLYNYVPTMRVRYPKIKIEDDSAQGWHWLKDPGELIPEDVEEMIADSRIYSPPKIKAPYVHGKGNVKRKAY